MSTPALDAPVPSSPSLRGALPALGAAVCVAGLLAALTTGQWLLAFAVLGAGVAIGAMLLRPDATVPIVLFVLYSNAAVVAVKFHGVPPKIAMLAAAPLMLPLAVYLLFRREKIVLTATLPWIVLYLVVQLVSALLCTQPELALQMVKATVLEGLFLYLVVTNVIRSERTLLYAVWALLAAGAFMGGLSVIQQATGTFHNNYGGFAQIPVEAFHIEAQHGPVQPRLCGPVGEQNRYAQIMLMLLPLGYFAMRCETAPWRKLLLGGATILAALGCALTLSRGAVIGFGVMLAVMAAMGYLKPSHLLALALGAVLLLPALPRAQTRLMSIAQGLGLLTGQARDEEAVDGAIRGRATSMLAAARVWADYPLLGVGPSMFNFYNRAYGKEGGFRALSGTRESHCLYLEIASETGTLGLLTFGAMLLISFRVLTRLRRLHLDRQPIVANLAAGLILALTAYLATGLFLHMSYARYFWLMLAIADSAAYVAARESAAVPIPAAAGEGGP